MILGRQVYSFVSEVAKVAGGLGLLLYRGLGLTGSSPAGRPEFPPSCGSGPVAVGSGLWGRSQLKDNLKDFRTRLLYFLR